MSKPLSCIQGVDFNGRASWFCQLTGMHHGRRTCHLLHSAKLKHARPRLCLLVTSRFPPHPRRRISATPAPHSKFGPPSKTSLAIVSSLLNVHRALISLNVVGRGSHGSPKIRMLLPFLIFHLMPACTSARASQMCGQDNEDCTPTQAANKSVSR
ncbi:hypothetical protein Salat_2684800 [Sesamum alatum]|uniref:Uncharacterized protein n=1 Tax=Sesamum alatum TaxID=300844 RepID=A0AAE2CB63_9LAMI|nr:hypothetical protein Salat_2684800 [Sesamum alatum]